MKRVRAVLSCLGSLLFVGCIVADDKHCIDWDSIRLESQECTPLYGNIICVDVVKTEFVCKLYEVEEINE